MDWIASYIYSYEPRENDSTIYLPLVLELVVEIIFTVATFVLGGTDGNTPIRVDSFSIPNPID